MCPIITKETYESLHTCMQFHVKLQQQWIKSVQMKAKTVRREKNHRFPTPILPPELLSKKHAKIGTILESVLKVFPTKTGELKNENISIQFCTQMRSSPKLRVH